MKEVILLLLISIAFCQELRVFRYKKGNFTDGRGLPRIVSGTFILQHEGKIHALLYMGTEDSTMIPFTILGQSVSTVTENGEPVIEFKCIQGIWMNKRKMFMNGEIRFTKSNQNMKAYGTCFSLDSQHKWTVQSEGVQDKHILYEPKKAGRRSRNLLGVSNTIYDAPQVIAYAISDMPLLLTSCKRIFNKFPKEKRAKPGFIIVGTDGKHCGIVDHEGNNFVHPNPLKGVITANPLSLASQFFPKGHEFRSYPKIDSIFE